MVAELELQGAEAVQQQLQELATTDPKMWRRVLAPTVRAGSTVMAREIRRDAPKGRIRKSVSAKVKRKGQNLIAKVGLNVGKKFGTAPHANLYALGTKVRRTKGGANRGRMRGNDFVRRATDRSTGRAVKAMADKLEQRIEIELAKRRLKS